jgi:hypothetical protein
MPRCGKRDIVNLSFDALEGLSVGGKLLKYYANWKGSVK